MNVYRRTEAEMHQSPTLRRGLPMSLTRQIGPTPGPCAVETTYEQRMAERESHGLENLPVGLWRKIG